MRSRVRRGLAICGAILMPMGLSGCVGEAGGTRSAARMAAFAVSCGDQYLEAVASSMSYRVDSLTPGETTGLQFDMAIPLDPLLKTREVVITVPSDFTFLGLNALGNGAQIGQWDFEWNNPDGTFDANNVGYTIPHYAIDVNTAYGDSFLNSSYDAGTDAVASYSAGAGGEHVITLIMPFGAADLGGNCSYFATDTRYTLLDGLFQLPSAAGDYDIGIETTSVDPDTGDADDSAGTAPSTYDRIVTVTVPEPSVTLLGVASLLSIAALRGVRQSA